MASSLPIPSQSVSPGKGVIFFSWLSVDAILNPAECRWSIRQLNAFAVEVQVFLTAGVGHELCLLWVDELTFWPLQLSCSAGLGHCWNSQEGHHHFQNQGHKSLRYVRLSRHRTMGSFRLLHCKLISPVGQDLKFLWTHCCWQILYRVIVPSTRGINIVINWVKSYLTLKCPSPKILYFLIWNYTL